MCWVLAESVLQMYLLQLDLELRTLARTVQHEPSTVKGGRLRGWRPATGQKDQVFALRPSELRSVRADGLQRLHVPLQPCALCSSTRWNIWEEWVRVGTAALWHPGGVRAITTLGGMPASINALRRGAQ